MNRGTIYTSRAILAALQPLQGDPSRGYVDVQVTGTEPVILRKGTLGVPIINGCIDHARTLIVSENPASVRGEWKIFPPGGMVAVQSILAGPRTELAADTQVAWLYQTEGLANLATVAEPGVVGGTLLGTLGAPRQILQYKDLGSQQKAMDFYRAQISDFPALVLSWSGTVPGDASAQPGIGANSTRLGAGKRLMAHSWVLHVICSRLDGHDERRNEGDILRDDVLEQLTDRVSYRGLTVSAPKGLEILGSGIGQVNPTSYVDRITFSTQYTLERRDDRVFNPWLRTRLREFLPTSQGSQMVVNATDRMPQG